MLIDMNFRRRIAFLLTGLLVWAISACQMDTDSEITASQPNASSPVFEAQSTTTTRIPATRMPTRASRPTESARRQPTSTLTPTSTTAPVEWTPIGGGVDERFIPVNIPNAIGEVYVYALRLDTSRVGIEVLYDREEPRTIGEWQGVTGASIVINGGFFSGQYTPVGRLVVDGTLYGFPLNYGSDSAGVPGLFTVLDGDVEIYGLGRSAYSPQGMRFDYAIESYPLLVLPGGQPTFPVETGRLARRTVIGLDHEGNLIVLFAQSPVFSLHTLSEWLALPDVGLDIALNLDGGRSSGLIINHRGIQRHFESVVELPIVIGFYARGN